MRRPRTLVPFALTLGSLLAVPASAQKEGEVERVAPGPDAPQGEVLEWTSAEGKPYWYRLPKKLSASDPPNLVLMLHGTGLRWGWAFWNYPIANGQFRGDDVVVAPEGMTPGQGGTFNFLQGGKDGDHVAGLIRAFKERLPIGRVYLYGHSQGAFFCYWFAGEYPELVDGIVAHAGNVLDVKHSKLAKDRVAIGILHGEADAVVPVECAYRTEKIYRDEGYRNVRLVVVEGLTEQSGHWPLPVQVAELLAWLDRVSVQTPRQALDVALAELAKEDVQMPVVGEALARARELAEKAKGEDREEVAALLATLLGFLEEAQSAHAARLMAAPELQERGLPFGAWAAHFVAADRAFGELDSWEKAMKPARTLAAKHRKQVDKALAGLEKANKRAFLAGLEALEEGYLATGTDDLAAALERLAADPPKGVGDDELAALRTLRTERADPLRAGREAAAALDGELAAALRESHPELFTDAN